MTTGMLFHKPKLYVLIWSLALSGGCLLAYALPPIIFLVLLSLLAVIFLFLDWRNIVLFTLSFILTTIAANLILAFSPFSQDIYYRPHELFARYNHHWEHDAYEANVDFMMTIPHGDLWALAIKEEVVPQPREVLFQTDASGYRNRSRYSGQNFVVVGDSFVAGTGTTQQDILTEQLRSRYGIDAYNLGFPGGIESYSKHLRAFERRTGEEPQVILVVFEGNDFPLEQPPNAVNNLKEYAERAYKVFRDTPLYRFMFSATRRIIYRHITGKEERVETHTINGNTVSFYKKHRLVSERPFIPTNSKTEEVICSLEDRISFIIFVPTKYRVYYEHITDPMRQASTSKPEPLPHKQYEFLRSVGEKCGIAVEDLTPALIAESNRLLDAQEYTYWTDDTHWNANGIAVAAKMIARRVEPAPESRRVSRPVNDN